MGNRRGDLPAGVDVRGVGGYVVLPPSVHPSGGRYTWLDDGEPAPLPYFILELLRSDKWPVERRIVADSNGKHPRANGSAYARRAFEDEVAAVRAAPVGARNETLNRAAFNLGQLVAGGELEQAEVEAALMDAAKAAGLPEREARKTIASGMSAGEREPRTAPLRWAGVETTAQAAEGMASPLSLDEVMEAFRLQEEGDAQLFARLNKGRAVYDPIDGAWYVWNGRHWKADAAGHVTALFNPVAAQFVFAEAELTKRGADEKVIEALQKRSRALRFKSRMNNVLHLARKYLEIDPSRWDNAPYKLVVANGVVDLRTGRLEPGNPRDFIRYAAPVEWRGLDEPAPLWEQTIQDIFQGDTELIAYFQRLMGVAVSGLSPARVFPIWQGEGGNGKSMILGVFQELLGPDLAGGVPQEVAVKYRRRSEGSHTSHLAALRGKRLAWVDEIERDDRVNVATVQMVTGGGPITARPAFATRPITFRPSHLFILSTNFRPQAESDYIALWDRIQLLPFEVRFVDDPKEGERRKDPELKDKLLEELPGILAWAVRGFMDFLARGQRLAPPDRVKLATEAYRRENDTVARFIEEACILEEGARVRAQEIHDAYTAWCEEEGEKSIRKQDFAKKMKERFGYVRSKGSRFYVGIRLADGID